jgi:hypothetical protein
MNRKDKYLKHIPMSKFNILIIILCVGLGVSCDHQGFLSRSSENILDEDKLWSNPSLVESNLANLYDRMPEYQELEQYYNFTNFDEAFPSQNGDYNRVQNQTYGYGSWGYWDYGYVYDINQFLERGRQSDALDPGNKARFLAEGHFLRANAYFSLVKRMGGAPIITETQEYDFSGDPSYLRRERASEAEVYDFVLTELDSALADVPQNSEIKSRVTWGAVMALKSRVALYAASIARYNSKTPSVSLQDNIVGIPESRAEEYYQIALDAAQELIDSGQYSLYQKYPDDLQKNFTELFRDKQSNPEVIFVQDYKTKSRTHDYTVNSQPKSLTEEGVEAGFINPSLNLVQSFEKLDNTFATLPNRDASGELIAYEDKGEIFEGRDARLGGTVMLPGSQFKGQDLDIWAGYLLSDDSIISGSSFGQKKTLPGESSPTQVVGFDGPIDQLELGTQTGFYVRKFIDPDPEGGQLGTQSDVWWIKLRYGEVLLNAAEAAHELGNNNLAAQYMNQIRERAGFTISLTPGDITFERIVHERRAELAFEGHQLWDYKRWRIAHEIWSGTDTDLDNPGNATAPSTRTWGLWPYKIYNPGNADHGKWVFKRTLPSVVTNAHEFRLGNYYSRIGDDILANNPLLIQNPNQ